MIYKHIFTITTAFFQILVSNFVYYNVLVKRPHINIGFEMSISPNPEEQVKSAHFIVLIKCVG